MCGPSLMCSPSLSSFLQEDYHAKGVGLQHQANGILQIPEHLEDLECGYDEQSESQRVLY